MEIIHKHVVALLLGGFMLTINGLPASNDFNQETLTTTEDAENSTVPKDLYVIRAVVYEVGILTNASSSEEDSSSDSNEEVDLSFFHQHRNGSVIDLSHIPVPLQTNISGQVVTGLAAANLGSVPATNNTTNKTQVPIAIPNAVLSVVSNYSTQDKDNQQNILSSLQPLLPLTPNGSATLI